MRCFEFKEQPNIVIDTDVQKRRRFASRLHVGYRER